MAVGPSQSFLWSAKVQSFRARKRIAVCAWLGGLDAAAGGYVGRLLVTKMAVGVQHLDGAGGPDQVTFRVAEVADDEVRAGVLLGAHLALPAEAFGLL